MGWMIGIIHNWVSYLTRKSCRRVPFPTFAHVQGCLLSTSWDTTAFLFSVHSHFPCENAPSLAIWDNGDFLFYWWQNGIGLHLANQSGFSHHPFCSLYWSLARSSSSTFIFFIFSVGFGRWTVFNCEWLYKVKQTFGVLWHVTAYSYLLIISEEKQHVNCPNETELHGVWCRKRWKVHTMRNFNSQRIR